MKRKQREALDSRREHVVRDQYAGLDAAEGKRRKRSNS
jgi:hypothetical protein